MLQGQSQEWSPPARTFKSKVRLERRFYSEAKHIFVASRAARVSLMCDYGIEPERIVFVGGGRNQPGISFLDDGELQRRLTDGIILFVGKDQERKGLQYLVAAIRELRELGCDYKLCIVGPLTLPKELVDEEWIDFKGRVTSPEVLQRVFRQAALFCLPSLQEAFGLVVPEAMSYGLPVIVTDVGEMPEIVRDRVDGIIVPSAEVEPLVQAMIEIMSNREHYARFSQSSHERSEGFTWTAVVERMIEVLRD
ncbi:glycosyltransferase family 4 protein [Pseudoclavibacter helvolus]|uniref:glycosyltransferase family 4 protein n=1 Tax=Pseudoclavibacter helvolus TaxID=255205 RepID=UPI001428B20D|nr:glycosyltransferase family 4 protein [Pseudoclavibacter helvolus]